MKSNRITLLSVATGLASFLFSCNSGENTESLEEIDIPIESIDVPELEGLDEVANYSVDPKESFLVWRGKSLTDEHVGGLKIKSGNVNLENNGQPSQALIVVDMNSITCTDIEDEDKSQKLVNHLKDEDFFEVSEYPEAKIQFSDILVEPDGILNATGYLTIKDITRDINVNLNWANNVEENVKLVAGYFVFDRVQFDIKYKSAAVFPDIGDKLINDEIGVEVMLVLKPKNRDGQDPMANEQESSSEDLGRLD